MAKLGELYKITSGGTPSRTHSEYYEDGTIPWVKTGDLNDKYLFETDEKISQLGLENSSARIYLKNTVLLAMYGATIGATSILKIDAATNQACAAFSPREDTLPEYLCAFLESQKDKFIKDAVGGAQPNLSAGYLKTIEFKLPSLEQQTRITRNLSKIDELLLLRKQQIAKLDELVKARFVEMFETRKYPIEKLGRVCEKITDGTHKTPTYLDSGIKFISAKNIIDGKVDLTDTKYISKNEYQEIQKRCQVEIQDILLTKSGTLGIPAIIRTDCALGLFESLAVIKYDRSKLLPYFLYEQLRCNRVQRQFKAGTKGVAVKHLHLGVISDIDIIVPPISYQLESSDFAEQVDKQKQTVQRSLEKLELMKKALMQEYFG